MWFFDVAILEITIQNFEICMGDSAHTTHHPSRRMTHCPQKCISKKLRNTKKTRRKSIGFLKTRLGNFLPYEFVGTMGHRSFINKRTVPILYSTAVCTHGYSSKLYPGEYTVPMGSAKGNLFKFMFLPFEYTHYNTKFHKDSKNNLKKFHTISKW